MILRTLSISIGGRMRGVDVDEPGYATLGTAAERIARGLRGAPVFDRWAAGVVDRRAYAAKLDAMLASETAPFLSENERALSARLHWRPGDTVAQALDELVEAGVLESTEYDVDAFAAIRDSMSETWDHGGRRTFIFPEEAQLLFAIANVTRPRTIAFLGSYYGYWAAWALAGAAPWLERAVLLDIDPDVTALAAANLTRLGLATGVEVVAGDAIEHMAAEPPDTFDLVVLDAEGPRTGPDRRFLGKRIYGPIVEAAMPRLKAGGRLVAHNILLDRLVDHAYFGDLVARNTDELDEFLGRVRRCCDRRVHLRTTEGVGVYRKTTDT